MRRGFVKWIAAASIICCWVLADGGGHMWHQTGSLGRQRLQRHTDVPAPTNTRAVITLADGSKVYLDSAGNGTIAQENNVNVVKNSNGVFVYSSEKEVASSELVYITLTNPRGSKVISLTLSDGTKVWRNSESSLRYPASFAAAAVREVEITGEAYFEVAHDAGKPFVVSKGETSVTVLGTHFNVNAYDDEDALRVTLLEGSVAVKRESSNVKIKPGEQAVAVSNSPLTINHSPDIEQVMAWKNGSFSFKSTDIKTMMRAIARWYDVDVRYEGNVADETITGDVSRNANLSQVMKMLEFAGFHFKIEGKQITVLK